MSTVTRLCEAIERGGPFPTALFTADVVLDATVPNWRFRTVGPDAVAAQLQGWFADHGTFEQLDRTTIPDGELVEFFLTWEEHGALYAAHQAHILTLDAGRIARITMFCGGRWPAALLAEMGASGHAH